MVKEFSSWWEPKSHYRGHKVSHSTIIWDRGIHPTLLHTILRLGLLLSSLFFYWLFSPLGSWPLFFSFMIILQMVGLLGRMISSMQGHYLNTGQHKHRINTYTLQTSMPCVGLEPMIPVSERAKTFHALERSATVAGSRIILRIHICRSIKWSLHFSSGSETKLLMNSNICTSWQLRVPSGTPCLESTEDITWRVRIMMERSW
jgi:hypothetical protein